MFVTGTEKEFTALFQQDRCVLDVGRSKLSCESHDGGGSTGPNPPDSSEDAWRRGNNLRFPSVQFLSGPWRQRRRDGRAAKLLLPVEIRATAAAGPRPAPGARRSHARQKQLHPAGRRGSDPWPRRCAFAAKTTGKKIKHSEKALKSRRSKLVGDSRL